MKVVFPAPLTPMTRITVGPAAAMRSAGSLFPSRSSASTRRRSASWNSRSVLMNPFCA
jgi:hypothetical protein